MVVEQGMGRCFQSGRVLSNRVLSNRVPPDEPALGNKPLNNDSPWFIIVLNLLCFIAHGSMVAYFAYFVSSTNDNVHYKLYTVQVEYTSNISNRRPTERETQFTMVESGNTIDIGLLCLLFHAISAGFHLLCVVMGWSSSVYYLEFLYKHNICWWYVRA